jgi:hypothetical protein
MGAYHVNPGAAYLGAYHVIGQNSHLGAYPGVGACPGHYGMCVEKLSESVKTGHLKHLHDFYLCN